MEHLTPKGRSGIVVPEGIIFQSGIAYKSLRKSLVEKYLVGVISLPSGVFNPYSGVKTSILILDKELSQKTDKIFFGKVENDGFDLGSQRREIEKNDLPILTKEVTEYLDGLRKGKVVESEKLTYVPKEQILGSSDIGLSFDRYIKRENTISVFQFIKLKELGEYINGFPFKPEDWNNEGIPIVRIQNLTKTSKEINRTLKKDVPEKYLIKRGDLLISWSATIGFYIWEDEDSYLNQHIFLVKPNEKILKNYFYFLGSRIKDIIQDNTHGNTMTHITKGRFEDIEIPLPPIEVQEEIVRELEQYQKIIDGAKQIIDNYKPVIDIDPSWEMKELSEVSIVTSGYSFKSGDFSPNGEVKSIKITNVGVNQFIEDENEYLPKSFLEKYKNFVVYEGDIVIALTRPVISNGLKITMTPSNYNESLLNQRVSSVRSKNDIVSQSFIYYVLNDKTFVDYVEEKSKSLMQPNLSINDLKMFQVPIPPIEIQQSIVERIKSERQIIEGNKKLIEIYTQKIQDRINKIWGE
jgi:type I restriction enzyme M protein